MLSVHTSPVEQPGTGDAGGMNVYVVELATRLAQLGVEVEIFTRATEAGSAEVVQYAPGVQVRHVLAGPLQGLSKDDLPGQLCAFAAGLMRTEARRPANWYDLVHSHYWLSGQVGWLVADRWNVPLVHSMHTMAKVKNAYLAEGDHPEPPIRVIGEEQVVTEADRLIASTGQERSELLELYQARPDRVTVIAPGVDLDVFRPGDRDADRAALGLRPDAVVLLFVGRIQPLKAPDVLVRAAAYLLRDDPTLVDRLAVVVVGGPSGSGLEHPEDLADLARSLGLTQHSDRADIVRFVPPQGRAELARWYRAADVAVVPSYNESFGLVAVEAQACGTPVVAADVGGLPTAVADGVSGVLVDGHDPRTWSCELGSLINDEPRRARLARGAVAHAQTFGWDACVQAHLQTYRLARSERLARLM
ncbi:MAG: D-inositol-3-phosphate glycosyltransferase [Micrococcales bacterium]|nr:MAG: D-inositol-3-phosphate glycosyltransferase [Micrococcales bacterium]PIE26863.1 MAG: D-inositol-3-phosphate glycosyltransferase [Micrococcales bacterium]